MTKLEFAEIMEDIAGAYPSVPFNEKNIDIWYKYLGSFSKDILSKVVSDYIRENSKAPSIADLYPGCTKLSKLYGTGDE